MGATALTSRAIIGNFYRALKQDFGQSWVSQIGMLFNSNQPSETYKWLGQVPAMREWVGGRDARGFYENGVTIANKKYEATLEVERTTADRDKTGQVLVRIAELARRTNSHWASLLSTLIIAGEAATCYDGQYFFDTDHTEGENSTSQSNDLSIDISAEAAAVHGTTTAPSPEEAAVVTLKQIQAILGFKDNEGEPMNENARNFLVMTPVSLFAPFASAVYDKTFAGGATNTLGAMNGRDFSISVVANARLTWTAQTMVCRTDGDVKPFILQSEKDVEITALAEGSENEFNNDTHLYGVRALRNVGYGYWQNACLATMT